MTTVQFKLINVPKWQKITIRTEGGSLTRDHVSFESTAPTTGTARYDIALDSKLTGDPAIAYIADDAWTGGFWMTGATCRAPEAAELSSQGSSCNSQAQISVRVTNPNPVTVTYQVGGQLPSQRTEVDGGETEDLVFRPVERGRNYQVTAEGSDGTTGSTLVNVPACTEPTSEPSNPTMSPPQTMPPQDATMTSPGTPGVPTPTTATVSVNISASATTSTSASATPNASIATSTSASPSPVPVPTVEANVDPFEPLLNAGGNGSMTLATPASAVKGLSNTGTLVIAVFLIAFFALAGTLAVRRRPDQGNRRS